MRDAPLASRAFWRLPLPIWKTLFRRAWREQGQDNIGLVAAGVSFYGFLALVPLLGGVVLSYGLVASAGTVVRNVRYLADVMPSGAAKLVGEQLMNVVSASAGKKGAGLAFALALALFGARNAAGGVITALNIAYEVEETRSIVRRTLLAILMTAAAVLSAVIAMTVAAAIAHLQDIAFIEAGVLAAIVKGATHLFLAAAGAAIAAALYRYGPAHHDMPWRWLTPGSLFASLGWAILTLVFGVYVSRFGNYDVIYGSLSAVIVLLTWLYLSSYVLLFGAELNSELEKIVDRSRAASK